MSEQQEIDARKAEERAVKDARNATICERYRAGASVQQCREEFQLSRERIFQIIRKAGIPRRKRSDRVELLGVEVSPDIKDALRAEAKRRGVSMSLLSAETLQHMLEENGALVTENGALNGAEVKETDDGD